MSVSELCTTFISSKKLKDDSERNIIEFAEAQWGLGQGSVSGVPALFPMQKFQFKCCYNIPLDDQDHHIIVKDKFNEKDRYRFTEIEYLNFLWNEGRINIKEVTGDPAQTRPNLLLVIGRRGLKTSSIAILVAYETYKLLKKICPQEYYRIMPDDEIRISCIATNQEQASELFRRIGGHLERSDYFKKYRNKPTLTYMQLNTQRDMDLYNGDRPSIRIVAAPCSGRGLRGRNNIIAVLDEMAYFFEAETSDDKSDKTVYDSVTPSVAKFNSPEGYPHGRTICISSPAAKTGKFFELFNRSMEKTCTDWLMIQAPTWEVDYTLSSQYLRSKYMENANTYMCEFGALFSDRVSAWIENEQILRVNIIPGLKEKRQSFERVPHFMGIDIGLKNDGSAIAICHLVKKEVGGMLRDFIELDCIDVRYAKDEGKEFFNPNELAEWIYSYSEKFFIVKGVMDQYYGLSILPVLHDKGLKQVDVVQCSRDYNSKVYQNLMSKMLEAAIRIPEAEEHEIDGRKTTDLDLVRELLKLQSTIHSKYMISVEAPEIKPEYSIKEGGYHDDLSDAFARAVYLAAEYMMAGGLVKNNKIESVSAAGASYRKYFLKQKRNLLYTNRPSSSIQAEMAKVSMNRLSAFGTLANHRWR